MAEPRPNTPLRLPLTALGPDEPAGNVTITAETIAKVVEDFYAACRADATLGPVFAAHVDDWDAHLERIRAFWGAALLRMGGYAGRPLEAHAAIPGLSTDHFAVWLRLFAESVNRHCTPDEAAVFMSRAGRMAKNIIANTPLKTRLQNPPA